MSKGKVESSTITKPCPLSQDRLWIRDATVLYIELCASTCSFFQNFLLSRIAVQEINRIPTLVSITTSLRCTLRCPHLPVIAPAPLQPPTPYPVPNRFTSRSPSSASAVSASAPPSALSAPDTPYSVKSTHARERAPHPLTHVRTLSPTHSLM